MTVQEILVAIEQLSQEEKAYVRQQLKEPAVSMEPVASQRVAGLGLGTIWMSDDFTAELPDEFWFNGE